MLHDGFDALVRAARAHGLPVELRPPALAAPDTAESLGQPLDPGLGSLYVERTGGGRVWELFLYPATGEGEGLADVNAAARMIEDDEPHLSQIVELAQLGYEATYFASLPEGAEAKGPQPVVYVDRNEGWMAVPIASTVDRMFGLLARYLERIIREYGEVATGRGSLLFPWDVPEMVAEDPELGPLVARGRFDGVVGPRSMPEVARFLQRL